MNIVSYKQTENDHPVENNSRPSVIQKKVDHLASICGTPVPEKIKFSLLRNSGGYLNIPANQNMGSAVQNEARRHPALKKFSKHDGVCRRKKSRDHSMRSEVVKEVVAGGYILERGPGKLHVTLTEDFWEAKNRSVPQKGTHP